MAVSANPYIFALIVSLITKLFDLLDTCIYLLHTASSPSSLRLYNSLSDCFIYIYIYIYIYNVCVYI